MNKLEYYHVLPGGFMALGEFSFDGPEGMFEHVIDGRLRASGGAGADAYAKNATQLDARYAMWVAANM